MTPAKIKTITIITQAGAVLGVLAMTMVNGFLPVVMETFDVDAALGAWITNIYLLTLGIMIPTTGYLMGRFSLRSLFLFATGIFIAGNLLSVVAPNFLVMIVSRVLQATGGALYLPLAQVAIFTLYPIQRRGTLMGIMGFVTGFAPALGPALAGIMTDLLHWRSVFLSLAVLSALVFLAGFVLLEKEAEKPGMVFDGRSMALSTLGFGGLLLGVTRLSQEGLLHLTTLLPLLLGGTSLLLFIRRQLRLPTPLLELRAFRHRGFTIGTILGTLVYSNLVVMGTLQSIFIIDIQGHSPTAAGMILLPGTLVLAFLSLLTGRLLDVKGPFLLVTVGMPLFLLGTAFSIFHGPGTALLYVGVAHGIRMVGIAAVFHPLTTHAIGSVPNELLTHATALINTVKQIGGALISTLIMALYAALALQSSDAASMSFIFAMLAVLALFLTVGAFLALRPAKGARDRSLHRREA